MLWLHVSGRYNHGPTVASSISAQAGVADLEIFFGCRYALAQAESYSQNKSGKTSRVGLSIGGVWARQRVRSVSSIPLSNTAASDCGGLHDLFSSWGLPDDPSPAHSIPRSGHNSLHIKTCRNHLRTMAMRQCCHIRALLHGELWLSLPAAWMPCAFDKVQYIMFLRSARPTLLIAHTEMSDPYVSSGFQRTECRGMPFFVWQKFLSIHNSLYLDRG